MDKFYKNDQAYPGLSSNISRNFRKMEKFGNEVEMITRKYESFHMKKAIVLTMMN